MNMREFMCAFKSGKAVRCNDIYERNNVLHMLVDNGFNIGMGAKLAIRNDWQGIEFMHPFLNFDNTIELYNNNANVAGEISYDDIAELVELEHGAGFTSMSEPEIDEALQSLYA